MLGFSMVERSRVLRWASDDLKLLEVTGETEHTKVPLEHKSVLLSVDLESETGFDKSTQLDYQVQRRLDHVEQQADFWIDLVSAVAKQTKLRSSNGADLHDVRENMLEMLFDLTEERVKEVYNGIDRDADGHISAAELGRGLQQYKLPELDETALARVLDVVTAKKSRFLQLPEFEAVLSRLKLAQVLCSNETCADFGPGRRLVVVDYLVNSPTASIQEVQRPRDFFFGHRPQPPPGGTLMRWVHLDGFDLTILLALTVKYSLHPLSVEDVLEQSTQLIKAREDNSNPLQY
jgi:hypothetical protein